MTLVDLYLNGKIYQIACDDGQEAHVKMLAERFDHRLRDLAEKLGPAPEPTLLALAALMVEDELHRVKKLENFAVAAAAYPAADTEALARQAAETLNALALRVERLVEAIET